MLRVVFMGTPDFAVPALEALHGETEIVGVFTQPDRQVGRGLETKAPPVKSKALELGLSVHQPEKLSDAGVFEILQDQRPDIIVVVAYGQLLRQNVLDLPRLGCVNIHSSLLPRWRGAAPIQRAILDGDTVSGVTTMKLVLKLDAGDILLQDSTSILADDTASSLHDRLSLMGAKLIGPTLKGLADGSLRGNAQDETQVTHAAKLTKEMEILDPTQTAAQLDRQVRALAPWPGTSLFLKELGVRLKVKAARPRIDISGPMARIFEKNGMVLLGTAEGSLELTRVQWDGKKETDVAAFLNGLKGRGQGLPLEVGR